MESGFPEKFLSVIDKYQIPKELIEVEITETLVVEDVQQRECQGNCGHPSGKGCTSLHR